MFGLGLSEWRNVTDEPLQLPKVRHDFVGEAPQECLLVARRRLSEKKTHLLEACLDESLEARAASLGIANDG